MSHPPTLDRRGHCGGPLKRGGGIESDADGPFVPAYVALHTSLQGPLAQVKFRTCPIAWCSPDANPEVGVALRAFTQLKRLGRLEAGSPKLDEAIEAVDAGMADLQHVVRERAKA